jgi:hypothetical protein
MFLSQIRREDGSRAVVLRQGDVARIVPGVGSSIELAQAAIAGARSLAAEALARGEGEEIDLAAALAAGQLLLPVDHPDPAHLHLTGTGLTHLGSAQAGAGPDRRPARVVLQGQWLQCGQSGCGAGLAGLRA